MPGKSFHDLVMEKEAGRHPTWAEVREARLKERKYPYNPLKGETLWEKIQRTFWRTLYFHREHVSLRHKLRWKRERAAKGWSEYDWWGMDHHLAQMIAGMVRKLRDEGHGYASQYDADGKPLPEGQAVAKWNTILTEMADGFDGYAKETLPIDSPAFKRAMELFAEWFPNLWD